MASIEQIKEFLEGAKAEFKRVVFPSKQQTIAASIGVISFTIFIAIYFGILDFLFSRLIGKILAF